VPRRDGRRRGDALAPTPSTLLRCCLPPQPPGRSFPYRNETLARETTPLLQRRAIVDRWLRADEEALSLSLSLSLRARFAPLARLAWIEKRDRVISARQADFSRPRGSIRGILLSGIETNRTNRVRDSTSLVLGELR